MAQTPQQRRANEAFARSEAAKRGKPVAQQAGLARRKEKPQKSPISPGWLYLFLFILCGGALVELLRIAFGYGANLFA